MALTARLALTALTATSQQQDDDDRALHGHYFGTSAEFWLNLQSLYEIRKAEPGLRRRLRTLPTLKRQTA